MVIAGFGLFGQTILEELQHYAQKEIDTIAIMGVDVKRRIQVVDEQRKLDNFCNREIFEGNISRPEVWQQLPSKVNLIDTKLIIILCTNSVEDNFRTSLWLKNERPDSMIIAHSYFPSKFAENAGEQYNILNARINQLVKVNFPIQWMNH